MALPAGFATVRYIGTHTTTPLTGATPIPVPAGANGVYMQARVQDVYIRFDNNPASTGGGFQIRAGDPPVWYPAPGGSTIQAVQGASGATLEVQGAYVE